MQARVPRMSVSTMASSPSLALRAMTGDDSARTGVGLSVTCTALVTTGLPAGAAGAIPRLASTATPPSNTTSFLTFNDYSFCLLGELLLDDCGLPPALWVIAWRASP